MDSRSAAMVEQHAETQPVPVVPQAGCRTLCQHPGCGDRIEWVQSKFGGDPYWVHLFGVNRRDHEATPVEQPEPAPGQQFVDSAETAVRAYQRGREEALPRQALEQPSSLVDALLEAAGRHGMDVVQSPGTYRAAELVAGLLQQIVFGPRGDVR